MFRRILLPACLAILIASPLLAQETPPSNDQSGDRNNNNNNDRGGRGNWDPAQMRERWMTSIKEQLGANDDEWKVIQGKLDKVMNAQRDSRSSVFGGGGSGGRRDGRGDRPSDQPSSPVQTASRDLRTALENKSATSEEITTKLTALREARDKARADLQTAQKDLKEVLTPRQEAVLVSMGMLE